MVAVRGCGCCVGGCEGGVGGVGGGAARVCWRGGGGGGVVGVQYGASCNKQANTNATQLLMLRPYTILQPNSLHHGPIVSHVNS